MISEEELLEKGIIELIRKQDEEYYCIQVLQNLDGRQGRHQYKRALGKLWKTLNWENQTQEEDQTKLRGIS